MKLNDRGPVFFRQVRVGRNGRLFRCLKFRTMVVDAEAKLAELQRTNERTGPLFKMDRDPRVTRVGQFLRDTSLDELPQLFNVLTGDMSLVGPRPALPDEVARFDEELLGPHRRCGRASPACGRSRPATTRPSRPIAASTSSTSTTGRSPSTSSIMLATVEQVIARAVTMVFKRTPQVEPACLERPEEPETAAA